jgi:ubiquinone/menaquinone biosynthesis C-methylase UbiE
VNQPESTDGAFTTRFDVIRRILADLGTPIRPEMKVMDFGCGEGGLVKAALAHGFDTYGCDLYDIEYSCKWHSEWGRAGTTDGRLRRIRNPYELPFDDSSIDVVISNEVFEHVQNYRQALAELRRVIRPGGFFLHAFPSRYLLIEPHIYVPLTTMFRPRWWLWLWAVLGVKNQFQKGLSAAEVVRQNAHFLSHGTNYLPPGEIKSEFARYFTKVEFVERFFLRYSNRARVLAGVPLLPSLYGLLRARFLYGVRDDS